MFTLDSEGYPVVKTKYKQLYTILSDLHCKPYFQLPRSRKKHDPIEVSVTLRGNGLLTPYPLNLTHGSMYTTLELTSDSNAELTIYRVDVRTWMLTPLLDDELRVIKVTMVPGVPQRLTFLCSNSLFVYSDRQCEVSLKARSIEQSDEGRPLNLCYFPKSRCGRIEPVYQTVCSDEGMMNVVLPKYALLHYYIVNLLRKLSVPYPPMQTRALVESSVSSKTIRAKYSNGAVWSTYESLGYPVSSILSIEVRVPYTSTCKLGATLRVLTKHSPGDYVSCLKGGAGIRVEDISSFKVNNVELESPQQNVCLCLTGITTKCDANIMNGSFVLTKDGLN